MSSLTPIAFDIETTGFGPDAMLTVAGFAHELGAWLVLNTAARDADAAELTAALDAHATGIELTICPDEAALLNALSTFANDRLDEENHYLTAFNGETWNGGFDLPFLRTACLRHDSDWPFAPFAYADMYEAMQRFDTDDTTDLVGVYDILIGTETCDPFAESAEAVTAFENGDWESLLLHNLADIQRTRELAVLAGQFVPGKDFGMKTLQPPDI